MRPAACLIGLLATLLISCGAAGSAPLPPTVGTANGRLSSDTVARLLAENTRPQAATVLVSCVFSEGTRCYYLPLQAADTFDFSEDPQPHTPEHKLERTFGEQIINQLEPKRVDRARNNTVLIQCQRAAEDVACVINGGPGWQQLQVTR